MSGVAARVEEIGPDEARRYLTRNAGCQRKVSRPRVERYARDMAAGRWALNGETIAFDSEGRLVDGQHRLHAVARSGATVPMLAVRGVEPGAFPTIDQGFSRTASAVLGTNGEGTTVTRTLASVDATSFSATVANGGKLSVPELVEWHAARSADAARFERMVRRIRQQTRCRFSTVACAAALYALERSGGDAEAFADDLCTAYTTAPSARALLWVRCQPGTGSTGREGRVETARRLLWLAERYALGEEPRQDRSGRLDLRDYD